MTGSWSLALCFCLGVNSQQGEQNHWALSIQEGENATMNCSYKATITTLQWYRQDTGRGLSLLILIRSNERHKSHARLQVTLDPSSKSSSLSITVSQAADSAAYFCAMDAQCCPSTGSPCTNSARAASGGCPTVGT